MGMKYFNPIYPARDGRNTIPQDEATAKIAALIIQGDSDIFWYAKHHGITVPTPNRSARIESRKRVSTNGEWITVRASSKFFEEVAQFNKELVAAEFSE
jgi:hypothetical protein